MFERVLNTTSYTLLTQAAIACLKLIIEQGVFIDNFEHMLQLVLMFLLLTLSR